MSSIKEFYAECQRCHQHRMKLLRCRDEKWFNVGSFGRSTFEVPQDFVVDGAMIRKVIQTVEYDTAYEG